MKLNKRCIKRIKCIISASLICFIFIGFVSATDVGSVNSNNETLKQEFEVIMPELLKKVNRCLIDSDLPPVKSIDFDNAFPYYAGRNYFSEDIRNAEDFLALIEDQGYYLWLVPIENSGKENLLMAIGKNTHDEWGFKWLKISPEPNNWQEIVLAQNPDADQIVMVNGMETTYSVMGVCIKDGELTEVISASEAAIHVEEGGMETMLSAADFDRSNADSTLYLHMGERFTYQEMQDSLGRLESVGGGLFASSGGTTFRVKPSEGERMMSAALLPIAVIALAGGVRVFLCRRKKS